MSVDKNYNIHRKSIQNKNNTKDNEVHTRFEKFKIN